jgi:hypothetical protein
MAHDAAMAIPRHHVASQDFGVTPAMATMLMMSQVSP